MKMFLHIQVVFLWRLLAFLCTFGEVELKPSTTTRTHYRGLQLFDANERISNQIDSSSLLRQNGDQVPENRHSNQWKRDEENIASRYYQGVNRLKDLYCLSELNQLQSFKDLLDLSQ